MQFILMHRTDAHWESGARPEPALIERVGKMIEELIQAGAFVAGEGLRASSRGARWRASGGEHTRVEGPYPASEGVPAGFALLQTATLDEAMHWARRIGGILQEGDIDVRPINEPWHIGMAPEPAGLGTTRFMALYKDPALERAGTRAPEKASAMNALFEEMRRAGVLLAEIPLRPTARGARLKRAEGGYTVTDGPFAEAKELIGGYAIVEAASKKEAIGLALKYAEAVGPEEVDVREIAGSS